MGYDTMRIKNTFVLEARPDTTSPYNALVTRLTRVSKAGTDGKCFGTYIKYSSVKLGQNCFSSNINLRIKRLKLKYIKYIKE